ncbi:amino acid adenylation domain-containing protein [Lysobacter koreensis]|uniref:Amino acid adenylation domain-containing protein n=1 Tax=Lysobacter koreensis TaxID=266122 RepID=A0ABW2YIW3_9GAMM
MNNAVNAPQSVAAPEGIAPEGLVDYDPFAQTALARVVPITEPQREVWLADKLGSEGSLAYNESISLHLRGALDADALSAAVRELGERHESLRATISPSGDELCIAEHIELETARRDLSALAPDARAAALGERLRAVVATPFDLEHGPLLRAELLRLADQEHVLLLTAHHIVCDGWSFGVLVHDLAASYARRVGQPGAGVLPAAQSFADYVDGQAAWANSAQAQDDERYWLSRFDGAVPALELPVDRPRPRQRTFAASREDVLLDADLVDALRKLGARRGASLFATLFTAFTSVLRRLSGQSDVVVGIAAAGQAVGGHGALVGHCVNILPVRSEIAPDTGFAAAIEATAGLLLDAFDHQQYTFGTLLKKLAIPRDPARLPLVSVLFNLDQPLDESTVAFPDLEFECSANPRSHENFELFVNAVPVTGGLRLECQYNRDLFDAASIRRWMGAYATLLRAAVEQPDQAIATLPLLDAPARAELVALQPAPTAYDRQMRAHEFFEVQADRTPARVAVRAGATTLSYAELEARSNRIAQLLRARGVRRGSLVGLALDRDADMLAAVLAVLKAGAGYVPLDPAFPDERLAYMVEDAGLAALLTQREHAARFDLQGRPVLVLDALGAELDAAASDRLGRDEAAALPDSIAYVIYTSGSTGRPKGVQVPHRCTANFIPAMQQAPGMSADDVLVSVTTLSFDIAFMELMLPLSVGAQVVIASREQQRDAAELRKLVEGSQATYLQATPAGWRLLVESGWQGRPGFKAVSGGEPLALDLAEALLARCGEVWNGYGPTETTIYSSYWRVQNPRAGIVIGRPVANTQVWVLDEQRQPCPIGVPGELWIGGDGVALGYLNRPELTAERFVDDPFSDAAGARLYRTGDRGRWRNDGTIEHLGRLDFQVKVRGYRIELGEIEANLASHPDVARCVVIAREDRPGDVRLVGYVVAREGAQPEDKSLLAHLRAVLPDYMVPQHLVCLAAIPLLPNSKVDRNALPAPDLLAQRAPERIAPRTELERQIAAVMEQVLALPELGVDDNFFALGGHSLLAAQLTTRLNRELGVSLSLRALFDAPTVERLAHLLESDAAAGVAPPPPIERRGDQRRAPLSLMQERLRMLEEFNPGQVSYNTPSGHRLSGPLDVALLDRALRDLAQRQTVLRTTIGMHAGEPVQVIHDDIETGLLQVQDLSHLPAAAREAELATRLRALVEVPFADLSQAPLFCARLFKLDSDEHVLFFMPHHIIWDGWSFDLLYAQLSELYAAHVEGRPPTLAELPVTYGDYAAWHREWVHGPEYARQLAFWRERLGGQGGERVKRLQAMPTDKPRRAGMSGTGSSQVVAVPKDLTIALRDTGLQLDATLFVILLTAYYALMSRLTGQRDLVVGTPVRGRNSAQVEELMGYFTNLLPLHVEVDPAQSFADTVKAVKAVVLDSFANPDIRLEDLVRELSLRSAGGGAMLYQSLFSFQDIRQRVTQWGPLRHERVEVFQPAATEDLGMWFIEDAAGLTGGLIYNSDIFHDATIVLLSQRYLEVLCAIVRDPTQSIEALTRFSDGESALIGDAVAVAGERSATDQARFDGAAGAQRPARMQAARPMPANADPRVRYLVDLWTELLGTRVEPGDNFFDLGGNSMLGVQMAERVARDTGLRIKLLRLASQNLDEIAADLPASFDPHRPAGLRSRLARNVRRLFGGTVAETPQ